MFGRGDAKASGSQHLTVRYRLSDDPTIGRMGDQDRANGTRQRAHDSTRNDDDLALIHTITMGAATLNELRVQRAGRLIEFDPTGYCSGCPSSIPHLRLGKTPVCRTGGTSGSGRSPTPSPWLLPTSSASTCSRAASTERRPQPL